MKENKFKILIIDDEFDSRELLKYKLLEKEDVQFDIIEASSAEEGWREMYRCNPDLIFLDIYLEGYSEGTDSNQSIEILKKFKILREIPVVLMSHYIDLPKAIATGLEAYDFIKKPGKSEHIHRIVRNAMELRDLRDRTRGISKEELNGKYEGIIGESPKILEVLELVDRVANTDLPVLILGETGTGKELVAYAVHENSSRKGEFIKVNCAAIPEDLLENEMFGHEKGAYTSAAQRGLGKFEFADRGTIFLDEIAEMPVKLQAKLLRVIEDNEITRVGGVTPKKVDVRIISATNRDLEQDVEDGKFRVDLYYRINAIPIRLPLLRERREDIPLLANYFAQDKKFSLQAMACLTQYDWPGNIRELKSEIEKAAHLTKDAEIKVVNLAPKIREYSLSNYPEVELPITITLPSFNIEEIKQVLVQKALEYTGGNKKQAASLVGFTEQGFYRMLKRFETE